MVTERDPLSCARCGHLIEDHHPAKDYRNGPVYDACVGAGYRKPWGVVCECHGFVLITHAGERLELPASTPPWEDLSDLRPDA